MGQELTKLISQEMEPGTYTTQWDAASFASGVYFCRIIAEGHIETKKLLLLK
jgi:hypothetical protein